MKILWSIRIVFERAQISMTYSYQTSKRTQQVDPVSLDSRSYESIQSIHSPKFFIPSTNIEKFVWIIRLH
ncbi:hypothetical protein EYC84_003474 [Monilinia fructicola]|uniref:Uncharacterized protein n=1 Tax=Monilinia fructicola TaxID=38448 RepID=A0A5M9JWS8_MONFR|nr:hypothetical protein EYC84_003474 [Monilinia fructicola]